MLAQRRKYQSLVHHDGLKHCNADDSGANLATLSLDVATFQNPSLATETVYWHQQQIKTSFSGLWESVDVDTKTF